MPQVLPSLESIPNAYRNEPRMSIAYLAKAISSTIAGKLVAGAFMLGSDIDICHIF